MPAQKGPVESPVTATTEDEVRRALDAARQPDGAIGTLPIGDERGRMVSKWFQLAEGETIAAVVERTLSAS